MIVRNTGSSAGVLGGAVRLNVIFRVGSVISEKSEEGSPTAIPGLEGVGDSSVVPDPDSPTGRGVSLSPAGVGIGVLVGSVDSSVRGEHAVSVPITNTVIKYSDQKDQYTRSTQHLLLRIHTDSHYLPSANAATMCLR